MSENEKACQCGHPKARHTFGYGFCTVSERTDGVGRTYCMCREYEEPKAEETEEV